MKTKILESKKELLKVEFEKNDEGFLSLIKKYLWKDKSTELAGYQIDHPEVGKPVFVLRTKGKSATSVWNKALDSAKKDLDELSKDIKKLE